MECTRLLKRGMTGEDVRAVKDKLVELGYLKTATHSSSAATRRKLSRRSSVRKGLKRTA